MAFKNTCIPRNIPRSTSNKGKREMTVEEFKLWLMQFDYDGDGRISRDELREALRSTGGWFTTWKSKRAVRSVDGNQSGFIEDNEISDLVAFGEKTLGVKIVLY